MKHRKTWMALLLCAALLLSGCAGKQGDAKEETSQKVLNFGCQMYDDGSVNTAMAISSSWNCMRYGISEALFRFDDNMNVEPWLHIHIVVKSKQCFTDAIAHTVPGGTDGHSRVDGPVIIHLTAEVQYLLRCLLFGIPLLPGAAGEQQCSAQEQRHPCFPMFHTLSSFHNLFPKYGAKKAGLPSD